MSKLKSGHKKSSKRGVEETISLHKHLKQNTYKTTLKRVRSQLPKKHHRAFSRLLHSYGMDSSHDLVASTFARPIALIVASVSALIGVGVGIYMTKSSGYSYNYLLIFLFFAAGYVIGLLLEPLIKYFSRFK